MNHKQIYQKWTHYTTNHSYNKHVHNQAKSLREWAWEETDSYVWEADWFDLEDKVGSLTDKINFLRNVDEQVLFLLLNILALVEMHHLPVVSFIAPFWSSVYA